MHLYTPILIMQTWAMMFMPVDTNKDRSNALDSLRNDRFSRTGSADK